MLKYQIIAVQIKRNDFENLMSKAKKKFASKFADSKVGKSVINKAIGEASEDMMNALKVLLIEHYGKKEGKNIVNLIYKFSVKAGIMFDMVFL